MTQKKQIDFTAFKDVLPVEFVQRNGNTIIIVSAYDVSGFCVHSEGYAFTRFGKYYLGEGHSFRDLLRPSDAALQRPEVAKIWAELNGEEESIEVKVAEANKQSLKLGKIEFVGEGERDWYASTELTAYTELLDRMDDSYELLRIIAYENSEGKMQLSTAIKIVYEIQKYLRG